MRRISVFVAALLAAGFQASTPSPESPERDSPRPIEAFDSVFMEDLTWMEIRDALAAGKTTAIVATGGVEQNGPYLATGKHNYVLRATTNAIARKLGNALVAPIVPFVPEGDIDPPTGHMRYPGTFSVRETTYRALLVDLCDCLRVHGFKEVVLIGDSGGNQAGLKQVAEELNQRWRGGPTRVFYVSEYYDYPEVDAWLAKEGIKETSEGLHDSFAITAIMMTVEPETVRMKERGAAGKFSINGVDLAPAPKTIEWGKKIIEFRANATIHALERLRALER